MKDIARIITELEQQRTAIDRAISALREIAQPGAKTATKSAGQATRRGAKRQLSPEGRRRIIEATKKRWAAARRAAAANQPQGATKKAGAKGPAKRSVKKASKKAAVTPPATPA